jgi:hypothetical protein
VLVGTERDSLSDDLSPWVRRYDASGNLSWSDVPTAMGVVFGAAVDADGTIATAAVGDDQFRLCRYPG